MELNGAPFKIAEGGVLAPTSKEAHVCNGKNGLHWLLGVPLDCHEFILCKIQPEFGASFLYHLFWWYFDKIHADSVETFQGTKHQTPGNSGRWVKQSHRIVLVRSWFIIAFQDIKASRFHHSFSHFSIEPTMWFHKLWRDDWAYNFGFQISSPGSLTFPIGYTPGQLVVTVAQPPTSCSFARRFVRRNGDPLRICSSQRTSQANIEMEKVPFENVSSIKNHGDSSAELYRLCFILKSSRTKHFGLPVASTLEWSGRHATSRTSKLDCLITSKALRGSSKI